ncbi:MAG: hypothetical protein QOK30_3410, partial [Nocardioidaceae bacterium]|nr:hypothetical protein [Nocardioidaceae bacterium]
MLSPQDVEFFRENGYYLYRDPIFSPDRLDQ